MSKEMREYRKMYRKHRKTMIQLAKDDRDWDWGFLHDLVITKVRHMYEYYVAGNNVNTSDEDLKVIIDSLKHVLDLQDELDNSWREPTEDDKMDAERVEIFEDGTRVVTLSDVRVDRIRNRLDRRDELYKELYAYIGQHIQYWWD
jgi:hypothetical protein